MNLGQYKALLNDSTKSDTQLGMFPMFVNSAIRELCRRRSWRGMIKPVAFTMAAGAGSAILPDTFKEPQSGLNALRAKSVLSPSGYALWFLYSKQEVERLGVIGVGTTDNKAFIDFDGTNWTVNTLGAPGVNTDFILDSYSFFPDLTLDTDQNYLTVEYPMMVLEQAKAYAFRHGVMDEDTGEQMNANAERSQAEADRQFMLNSADDAYRQVRGRRFRMGGY